VLGTLDHDERRGASALLEVDSTFRDIVRIWENRLGELHLMVEAVEPDPQLWERIRSKIAGIEQITPAIAPDPVERTEPVEAVQEGEVATAVAANDVTSPPEPATSATTEAELQLAELAALQPATAEKTAEKDGPEAPAVSSPEPVSEEKPPSVDTQIEPAEARVEHDFVPPPPMVRRSPPVPLAQPADKSRGAWMATSLMLALVAIVLAGLIGAWRFFPERLPAKLRAYTVLNLPAPPPPAAPALPRPRPPAPFEE